MVTADPSGAPRSRSRAAGVLGLLILLGGLSLLVLLAVVLLDRPVAPLPAEAGAVVPTATASPRRTSAARTSSPRPTASPSPTPAPTAPPWDLGDARVRHPPTAPIGSTFSVVVTITNRGTELNPTTIVSLNGLEQVAEIAGCKPGCTITGMEAVFAGLVPGKPRKLQITLVATALGRADYNVCVYATERSSSQVGCVVGLSLVVTR